MRVIQPADVKRQIIENPALSNLFEKAVQATRIKSRKLRAVALYAETPPGMCDYIAPDVLKQMEETEDNFLRYNVVCGKAVKQADNILSALFEAQVFAKVGQAVEETPEEDFYSVASRTLDGIIPENYLK